MSGLWKNALSHNVVILSGRRLHNWIKYLLKNKHGILYSDWGDFSSRSVELMFEKWNEMRVVQDIEKCTYMRSTGDINYKQKKRGKNNSPSNAT